jgi:ABC-type Fe3+/spermidine/putrescine transport system ATPase subunit
LELKSLQQKLGVTTIFVTHDQEEAMTISDRIAVMNLGRIEQIGAPREVYNRPRTRFVADFIGDINLIEGEWRGGAFVADGTPLPAPAGAQSGGATIAIRPERVRLAGTGTLKGRVATRIFVSGQVHYRVRLDTGRELAAKANEGAGDFAIGAEVGVDWAPGDVVVLTD